MTIDHVCCNKGCVNPGHLDVTSRGENARRHTRMIDTCPVGHTYDEVNTYTDRRGRRKCRACALARYHAGKHLDAALAREGGE